MVECHGHELSGCDVVEQLAVFDTSAWMGIFTRQGEAVGLDTLDTWRY